MRCSAGAARRGASGSPFSCRRNTQPAPESRSFPRSHRLTRDAELQAVRREGKRIRTGMIEVRVLASPLLHSRAGIIVPKYKHTAVERNTLKRRLRELVRLRLLPALAGGPAADVVLRAFPGAYAASFETLERELMRVLPPITAATQADRRPDTVDTVADPARQKPPPRGEE